MKKSLKKVFGFITTLAILYITLINIIGSSETLSSYFPNILYKEPGGYGNQLNRSHELQNTNNVDLVFIGSSHSYRGFDPRIYEKAGISTFNLGNSQQTPFNSYYLLEEYIDQLNPKTVVIENFWRCLQIKDNGIESSLDLIINSPISWTKLKMAIMSKDALAINTLAYSYTSRIFKPLYSHLKNDKNYVSGGYVENSKKINEESIKNIKPTKWTLKEHQIEYLNKCIRMLKKKNIEVIIASTPVTEEFLTSIENRTSVFNDIDSLVIKPNKVKNLNYNLPDRHRALGLISSRDFYDNNHLNTNGVNRFNTVFIHDLINQSEKLDSFSKNLSKIFFIPDNIVKNYSFSDGLSSWSIKGDSSLIKVNKSQLIINSTNELSGITQYSLKPNENYTAIIDVENINKGGLKFFVGYNKIRDLKPGINIFKFNTAEKVTFHIYRNGITEATINSVQIYKSDDNIILNSNFNLGLQGWETKGEIENSLVNGVRIISKDGTLSGLTQRCLKPNTKYKVVITISQIKEGGIKVFNGFKDLNIDLKEGENMFEFDSNEKISFSIYRKQNKCDVTIQSVKIWEK